MCSLQFVCGENRLDLVELFFALKRFREAKPITINSTKSKDQNITDTSMIGTNIDSESVYVGKRVCV